MSIQCRTLVACGILAALTLSGCEMPRPRQAAGPTRARPVSRVLDPADINLALEPEGLTVWWRHDLGQLAEGASLRKLYLVGDRLVAEMRDTKLLYFDAATGEWTGSTRLKSLLMAPPAASKGLLYVPSARNLLLVDSRTGMVSKRLLARLPVSCRPLPFADFLILGGGNGQLRCIRCWLQRARCGLCIALGGEGVGLAAARSVETYLRAEHGSRVALRRGQPRVCLLPAARAPDSALELPRRRARVRAPGAVRRQVARVHVQGRRLVPASGR